MVHGAASQAVTASLGVAVTTSLGCTSGSLVGTPSTTTVDVRSSQSSPRPYLPIPGPLGNLLPRLVK
jgi:hypothetical protein